MPFSARNLNDAETLVLDLHPHWWFLGPQSITLASVMFCSAYLLSITTGWLEAVVLAIGLGAIVASSSWLIVGLIKWRTTYFVVTSHRLIYREGVVARNGVEIPLERVNNVNFNQSVFERFLQVGDLLVESGGQEGQQVFTNIARPEEVQNIIHSTIQREKQNRSGDTSSVTGVAHELERLEGLVNRGMLTDEEFELQKRRLLG